MSLGIISFVSHTTGQPRLHRRFYSAAVWAIYELGALYPIPNAKFGWTHRTLSDRHKA